MSSSFFRGSCAIFWLTWLITLSYLLGTTVYESKYVLLTPEYEFSSGITKFVCFVIIGLSFTGCVFVKCDISHILCFLLYTIPLFFIVPSLCIYGIVITRELKDMLTNDSVYYKAYSAFNGTDGQRGVLPTWLENTETEHDCCGVYSWKDYPLLFFNGSYPGGQIVPSSCCKNLEETEEHCIDFNKVKDFFVSSKDEAKQTPEETDLDEHIYKKMTSNGIITYFLNDAYRSIINTAGCAPEVMQSGEDLRNSHQTFLVILAVVSILMAIVYVKNWSASQHSNGARSAHSLDVEQMSLWDQSKQVEPINVYGNIGSVTRRPSVKRDKEASTVPRVGATKTATAVGVVVPGRSSIPKSSGGVKQV